MHRFCHPAKKAFKNLFGCVFRATNPSMYIPPGEVLWARESFSLEEPCALGLTPASCKNYAVCYWTCNLLQLLNRSQPVHTTATRAQPDPWSYHFGPYCQSSRVIFKDIALFCIFFTLREAQIRWFSHVVQSNDEHPEWTCVYFWTGWWLKRHWK